MAVYVIATVKVNDDSWIPDYAAHVHDIVHKHVESICLAAAALPQSKASRRALT